MFFIGSIKIHSIQIQESSKKKKKKKKEMGGLSLTSSGDSHNFTHKIFLLCNYILLGAASSCIFLTLSLRLIPSLIGLLVILLHVLTIAGAISGCAAVASTSTAGKRWYGIHMVSTVLTAIFQGSVAVLIFTTTGDFLGRLNSYVREDDGKLILKLAGGLCVVIFCLEWVVLTLAFFLNYYAYVDGAAGAGHNSNSGMKMGNSSKVGSCYEDDKTKGNLPFPFQV